MAEDALMPPAMEHGPLGSRIRTFLHHLRTGGRELSDEDLASAWWKDNPRYSTYRSRFAEWSERMGEFRITDYESQKSSVGAALAEGADGRRWRCQVVVAESPPHLILGSAVFSYF